MVGAKEEEAEEVVEVVTGRDEAHNTDVLAETNRFKSMALRAIGNMIIFWVTIDTG